MSDETQPSATEKPIPPMTANDWQMIVQSFVVAMTVGTVLFEVHPVRWALIVEAAMKFGGPIRKPIHADDGSIVALSLELELEHGKPIRALMRRWERCPATDCAGCDEIEAQTANYLQPKDEAESPIILLDDRRPRIIS